MSEPIIHKRTRHLLENYLNHPSHALLLLGPTGIGKKHLACWVANQRNLPLLPITPEEQKKGISVQQIRNLYSQSKTGSSQIVLVSDTQNMSSDAQNAFLKLLEEPPGDVSFILTANKASGVLPTIRSRCQIIEVLPPNPQDLLNSVNKASDSKAVLATTKGLPGAFFKIISDTKATQEHLEIVAEAKEFYGLNPYERHLMLLGKKFDKSWALDIIGVLITICRTLINARGGDRINLERLIKQAELLEITESNLVNHNGNLKIHLTKLANLL